MLDVRAADRLGDRLRRAFEELEAFLVVGDEDRAEKADRCSRRVHVLGGGTSAGSERLQLAPAVARTVQLDEVVARALLHADDARARGVDAKGGNPPRFGYGADSRASREASSVRERTPSLE